MRKQRSNKRCNEQCEGASCEEEQSKLICIPPDENNINSRLIGLYGPGGQISQKEFISKYNGIIKKIDNKDINYLARITGCPVDKTAGVYIYKHIGEYIQKGEKIITIFSESKQKLKEAVKFFKKNKSIVIK